MTSQPLTGSDTYIWVQVACPLYQRITIWLQFLHTDGEQFLKVLLERRNCLLQVITIFPTIFSILLEIYFSFFARFFTCFRHNISKHYNKRSVVLPTCNYSFFHTVSGIIFMFSFPSNLILLL